jgi:hypothetical protein
VKGALLITVTGEKALADDTEARVSDTECTAAEATIKGATLGRMILDGEQCALVLTGSTPRREASRPANGHNGLSTTQRTSERQRAGFTLTAMA